MPNNFKVTKDRRVFLDGVEVQKCLGFTLSFEAGEDPELLLRVSCDSVDIQDYSLKRKEPRLVSTTVEKWIRHGETCRFFTAGFNQIIVFQRESDFKEAVAANSNMTAIVGDDGYTTEHFPGVYIAAVGGKEDP